MSGKKSLDYSVVDNFQNCKIPQEIEDEILETFAKYSIEHDMDTTDLNSYFEDLQMPHELYKLVRIEDVVVEDTKVIDFDKIVKVTYHLLIYMNNDDIITSFWNLLVKNSGRLDNFPNVRLKDHVLSVKDLQKIDTLLNNNVISSKSNSKHFDIIGMMSCATGGSRVYMTYLDFANVLGRLGYLQF
ncbi:Rad33p PWA37_003220 [Arxiozyma heterogenica]|uniref:Uncharacterized protein n=1 Tax=Arxiozyma heterogenica TaxID=278026 RepID=A0AAN8A8R2_9SACH|nr:hypothetical protein RI543_001703 [Kazachstania heterogenica]